MWHDMKMKKGHNLSHLVHPCPQLHLGWVPELQFWWDILQLEKPTQQNPSLLHLLCQLKLQRNNCCQFTTKFFMKRGLWSCWDHTNWQKNPFVFFSLTRKETRHWWKNKRNCKFWSQFNFSIWTFCRDDLYESKVFLFLVFFWDSPFSLARKINCFVFKAFWLSLKKCPAFSQKVSWRQSSNTFPVSCEGLIDGNDKIIRNTGSSPDWPESLDRFDMMNQHPTVPKRSFIHQDDPCPGPGTSH